MPPKRDDHSHTPLELDTVKYEFTAKTLAEIKRLLTRCTGVEDPPALITGVLDYSTRTKLRTDEEVEAFFKKEVKDNGGVVGKQRCLKFDSHWWLPPGWSPKQKALTGETEVRPWFAKYFSEEEVSTRVVEISLKLWKDPHRFRVKQRLHESGKPYVQYFEGTWRQKGVRLELFFGLKYLHDSRQVDLVGVDAPLAGESEQLLTVSGQIPAILGKEPMCWVSLQREPDKVGKQAARFHEEKDEEEEAAPAPAAAPPHLLPMLAAGVLGLATLVLLFAVPGDEL